MVGGRAAGISARSRCEDLPQTCASSLAAARQRAFFKTRCVCALGFRVSVCASVAFEARSAGVKAKNRAKIRQASACKTLENTALELLAKPIPYCCVELRFPAIR